MRCASLVLLLACGGAPEAPPAATTRAASPIATAAGASDEIVAQVNGRPVWASCVAAQGARTEDVRRALDECIAFELLAQAADKRGLGAAPDVVDATRTAMVNKLVEVGFEQHYQKPADLGERFTKWMRDNAFRANRPDLRTSTFARVVVTDDAQADAAKRVADQLYGTLANETGLFSSHLRAATTDLALHGLKLEVADTHLAAAANLDATYAGALFAIPEVGRVAPPVRTKWGWDVILWTGGLPPLQQTHDELAAAAFPELRRSMFPVWVGQIARELGIKPEVDAAGVQRLEEVGP